MNAITEDGGAGIGGGHEGSGGTITINSGTVNAGAIGGGTSIGRGYGGADNGTLTLGDGIVLEVSSDNANWSDYNGETRDRYMRTK